MSVILSMEAVNRSVPMLLVALPAAVGQGTCWMEMISTALVSLHKLAFFPAFLESCLPFARIERKGLRIFLLNKVLLSITICPFIQLD